MSEAGRKVTSEGAHVTGESEAAKSKGGTAASAGGASGGMEHGLLARPFVLPEIFDGTGSWSEWSFHFENVAVVNGWDDEQRLQWLRVRVTGRAQKALHRLTETATVSYEATRDALRERFEPESRRTRHQAEFQARRKRPGEGWADLADDLRSLADKAYPALQEEARERLSINAFLTQLPQPQVSFSMRQKQPSTLDDAVAATLEMESYLPSQQLASVSTAVSRPDEDYTTNCRNVDAVDPVSHLTMRVEKLVDQVEKLQVQTASASSRMEWSPTSEGQPGRGSFRPSRGSFRASRRGVARECWNCHRRGHLARNCPVFRPKNQQGNDTPGTADRVSGGESGEVQPPISISPITGGYRVPGSINGVNLTLLVDTGAAVTLLREDVWTKIATRTGDLKPWSGVSLVSAGGTALTIHGSACVSLKIEGRTFPTELIVVSPLTSQAILGVDFLRAQQATIDLGHRMLHLRESGCDIPLINPELTPSLEQTVRMASTVEVPPRCRMEVTAWVGAEVEGIWLVEEAVQKHVPVAVARAVVEPQSSTIPVCVLNLSGEPVTLYAGSVIATMTPSGVPVKVPIRAVEGVMEEDIGKDKLCMLRQLVEEKGVELDSGEKDIFYNLLLSHADVLASSDADLGRTNKLRHHIDTGSSPPVRQPVRRLSPHRRGEVKQLLSRMLDQGVIEPSSSPWASPVVLVQKKDGSIRFCVDYRKLNQVTQKDAYPLPRIDMTLDALHGSQWFSTLDLVSGYWQVEVEEGDREKTAFCTTEGLYQFKVMPFGLCNAPASFQRLMDLVLTGIQWSQCLVYLDDIIILGRSFDEHIRNLDTVFKRLREGGLRLKPSKCNFFRGEVQYLGHIISRDGVATDPAKVAKVATWPAPMSKREVQQFLGFANYYRRFIRDFARVARPLHRLTEKTASFVWSEDCQRAFDQLRTCLCSAPVLAYPDFSRPFILDTDASDVGLGGVLSQVDDEGRERVIAYGSRLLTKPERKYCVTRRELLAVITFIQQYRPYLICQKFMLRTDHGSLTWLKNFKDPEGQLARWLERLQELEFDIVHRKGKVHCNADALSRLPCRQCGRPNHDTAPAAEVAVAALQLPDFCESETLRQVQLADPVVGALLRGKEAGSRPEVTAFPALSKTVRRYLQIWEQLEVQSGILCRRRRSDGVAPQTLQTVIPDALREEVLSDLHEGKMGGHLGADKTLGRLRERFYWPGHYSHVREWCRDCAVCASRKSPPASRRAPLQPITTSYPLQLVATDIMGPLPESTAGNSYILVVADYFTRYVEAYPIPNQEATTVAQRLVDEFFFRFSPPEQLHSDQGRNFESAVIAEACKLLGVDKSRTTPYHPQSDGLVERFNRTLLNMLATAVTEQPFEWEQHLRRLCFAYNTSVHPTTGYSPFALMFGRKARVPMDIILGTAPPPGQTIPQYVTKLHNDLKVAYGYVRNQMGHHLQQQKSYYDGRLHGKPYKVGDMVWLHSPAVQRGRSKKLHRPWTGPYKVVSKLSDVVYRLQHVQARRKRPVVHFNRLKPCSPSVRLSLQETQPEQVVRHSPPARALPIGGGVELLEPRRIIRYQTHRSPPRNQLTQEEPSGSAAADELSTSRGSTPADEAPTSSPSGSAAADELSTSRGITPADEAPTSSPSGSAAADELSTSRGITPADEALTSVSRSPSPQPSSHSPPSHRYPQRHRTVPDRLYARVTH